MNNVIRQQINGHDVAFRQNPHLYLVDGRPVRSVTQILKGQRIIDTKWFTEAARIRGHLVHEITAMMDLDKNESINTRRWDLFGYIFAWKLFLKETGFRCDEIERIVYCEDGDYAGMYDRSGAIHGDRWLLDIKTGQHQRWHGLQLAAYTRAAQMEGYRRGVVHLRENGKYYLCTGDRRHGDYDDPIWDTYWDGILMRERRAA